MTIIVKIAIFVNKIKISAAVSSIFSFLLLLVLFLLRAIIKLSLRKEEKSMGPNYFHVQFKLGEKVSYNTPSAEGREVIPIKGAEVTKMIFADGNELLSVIHNETVDVYASFPIVLEYH